MNEIIGQIIHILHTILIIGVVGVPFLNMPYFLLLHSVFVPFMILHWLVNDNTCVLTTLERNITHKKDDECITCRLINPIFDFKKNNSNNSKTIYIITIVLWCISTLKLYLMYKSGKLSSLNDLFQV